jgi:hypothetical protein
LPSSWFRQPAITIGEHHDDRGLRQPEKARMSTVESGHQGNLDRRNRALPCNRPAANAQLPQGYRPDESMGEKDPLLAKLLAAATVGAEPAGPANKRAPIRIVLDPDDRPVGKGVLCGRSRNFNLQAATRVAANDKPGRERLCRYILRPPLANDRLSILDDGNVRPGHLAAHRDEDMGAPDCASSVGKS